MPAEGPAESSTFIRYQEPEFLTFEEIKALSRNPVPQTDALSEKLAKFWVTPIISNEAYFNGAKPHLPKRSELGRYLRLLTWNIEKSIQGPEAVRLFTATEKEFVEMLNIESMDSERYQVVYQQWRRMLNADVILLQEMEIGIKRSGYKNTAAELAKVLNMNYVYAAQYLEVDPVLLGLAKIQLEDGQVDEEAVNYFKVDPARFKGVFGSAVLSRYPIKHVEIYPLKTQPYDWYEGEKQKTTYLEHGRRFGAKTIFKNEITREMKVGGRHYFRVDLEVPELKEKTLSVINIHLEIKCLPKDRQAQIEEVLDHIRPIENPVIMAGDFNAAPTDLSPTSVRRTFKRAAKNPTNWLSLVVNVAAPQATAINVTRGVSNLTKNFQDPLARSIPIVAPNPTLPMFQAIDAFVFDDGKAFDFRGDSSRSVNGKKGTLSNSNQRDFKGFKTTFAVKRPLGPIIGKYRLDWIFVKAYLRIPKEDSGPYRFAPHFGETLEELNTSLLVPISDHHPSVVDLPFDEPQQV